MMGLSSVLAARAASGTLLPHMVTLALPDTSFLEEPVDWLEEAAMLMYVQE